MKRVQVSSYVAYQYRRNTIRHTHTKRSTCYRELTSCSEEYDESLAPRSVLPIGTLFPNVEEGGSLNITLESEKRVLSLSKSYFTRVCTAYDELEHPYGSSQYGFVQWFREHHLDRPGMLAELYVGRVHPW